MKKWNGFFNQLISALIITLFFLSLPVAAEDLNPRVKQEIDQLLVFVEESGCMFNRNGRWYDSKEAAAHITKKYRYVLKKGLVKTTEDFINYAATQSSMTKKAYTVQCEDSEIMQSAQWLGRALVNIRNSTYN